MSELLDVLREGAARERGQTRFYRHLSTRAELAGDPELAERLNELLADEQHHVSRLTARLLELGGRPVAAEDRTRPSVELEEWEAEARRRESAEVAWYRDALASVDDEPTLVVLREILESERHHLEELGGKWMAASPPVAGDDPGEHASETERGGRG